MSSAMFSPSAVGMETSNVRFSIFITVHEEGTQREHGVQIHLGSRVVVFVKNPRFAVFPGKFQSEARL